MATTCALLIAAALNRRTANDADKLATPGELIGQLDRIMKGIYLKGSKINPGFFGTSASVAGTGTTWLRPVDAHVVTRVEANGATGTGADRVITVVGTEINVVPFNDRDIEFVPRIYRYGGLYYSEGGATNPSPSANGDTLKFYYSKRHPDFNTALAPSANTLDATWNDALNGLPIAELARYLCIKAGRGGTPEAAGLDEEIKGWDALFMAELALDNDSIAQRNETE